MVVVVVKVGCRREEATGVGVVQRRAGACSGDARISLVRVRGDTDQVRRRVRGGERSGAGQSTSSAGSR